MEHILLNQILFLFSALKLVLGGHHQHPGQTACPWPAVHEKWLLDPWLSRERDNSYVQIDRHTGRGGSSGSQHKRGGTELLRIVEYVETSEEEA